MSTDLTTNTSTQANTSGGSSYDLSGNGLLWKPFQVGLSSLFSGWKSPNQVLRDTGSQTSMTGSPLSSNQTYGPIAPAQPQIGINLPGVNTAQAQTPPSDYSQYVGGPVGQSINDQHSNLPISQRGSSSFSITPPDQNGSIPGNMANNNVSWNDVLNQWRTQQQNMINGSNPGLYPTRENASHNYYTQTLPNSIQMSPEQQNAYTQLQQQQKSITDYTLQTKQKIADLYGAGTMTKDQADQAAQDIQREADAHMAQLQSSAANAGITYNAFELARQNTIDATKAMAPFYQPTEVSPGSQLVSPGSGQMLYQGNGASQQTILSGAMQLWQAAGSPVNTDGSPNIQPYLQSVQQYYGGGNSMPSLGGSSSYQGNTNQQSQGSSGTYGSNGYGNVDMIPQGIRYAVRADSIGNQSIQYINASQLSPTQLSQAYQTGGPAGIPVLDQGGVSALNAAQQILDIVDASKALAIRNLSSGTSGRISNAVTNWANNYLQFNPDLSNFDQLRDAASKATTALAGGNGSGFRMNMGIIEAAVGNLPRASDNLETALTRADALATQIINGLKPVFPNVQNGSYGNLLQSQYTNPSNNTQLSGGVSAGGFNFIQDANGNWIAK